MVNLEYLAGHELLQHLQRGHRGHFAFTRAHDKPQGCKCTFAAGRKGEPDTGKPGMRQHQILGEDVFA